MATYFKINSSKFHWKAQKELSNHWWWFSLSCKN